MRTRDPEPFPAPLPRAEPQVRSPLSARCPRYSHHSPDGAPRLGGLDAVGLHDPVRDGLQAKLQAAVGCRFRAWGQTEGPGGLVRCREGDALLPLLPSPSPAGHTAALGLRDCSPFVSTWTGDVTGSMQRQWRRPGQLTCCPSRNSGWSPPDPQPSPQALWGLVALCPAYPGCGGRGQPAAAGAGGGEDPWCS